MRHVVSSNALLAACGDRWPAPGDIASVDVGTDLFFRDLVRQGSMTTGVAYRNISASGYLLYFPVYYSRSLFVTPPDVIPRAALVLGGPLPALVPGDLRSALPPPSRRRVLVHLCGGSADSVGDAAATALRAPSQHRLRSFTSPTCDPPSLPQLDYTSLLAPSCFAPGLRMRSPYRRTCTVCVHIPIRIPLRLQKHRLRKQDYVVERSSATISYPRLVSRRGREDLGADAHARSAPRRAPPLLVVPSLLRAKVQLRVLARKRVRSAGWERRDVARDVRNSYLCRRLATPPMWDAIL
ncbi:hypothetical protein DFH08DRAFT_816400 [Mycena albidolilacea]|uniref:Uncharacterized protein n=1 Tax=Mycena albidolilacea TaxID=1033008 RepID=A0AAD7EIR9_9AGAR|nr:hypothetical protein DFH08DRAFT_816400 [Mycena albidolilacea]